MAIDVIKTRAHVHAFADAIRRVNAASTHFFDQAFASSLPNFRSVNHDCAYFKLIDGLLLLERDKNSFQKIAIPARLNER